MTLRENQELRAGSFEYRNWSCELHRIIVFHETRALCSARFQNLTGAITSFYLSLFLFRIEVPITVIPCQYHHLTLKQVINSVVVNPCIPLLPTVHKNVNKENTCMDFKNLFRNKLTFSFILPQAF